MSDGWSGAASSGVGVAAGVPAVAGEGSAVPWYCKAVVFGATSIMIGILWDISWHKSIGRDTFWTPAHMAIYLGGALGGICCGWLVLKTTFAGTESERAASVRIWGLYGPIGAWVCIWGALAMLTSAPFDDWWHNTYGLDVRILSPPHTVLALGMHHIVVGALLLVLSLQNRAASVSETTGQGLYIYAAGIMLAMSSILLTEFSWPNLQHSSKFYQVSCAMYPFMIVSGGRAGRVRWACTKMAAIYMLARLLLAWVLPLFEATPKLAPIYNPVDSMVPPPFPHWLIVPAVAMDLLMKWDGAGRGWKRDWILSVALGAVFLLLLLPVQWWFSIFQLSSMADNWFLIGSERIWPYSVHPGEWMNRFWDRRDDPLTWRGFALALAISIASARVGLWGGNWMARVKR